MKNNVHIVGAAVGGTVIVPTAATNTIITGCDNTTIKSVTLNGATAGRAVYFQGTTGRGFLLDGCIFANCGIMVDVYGASAPTTCLLNDINITGFCNTLFNANNAGSVLTRLVANSITYSQLTLPTCNYVATINTVGTIMNVTNSLFTIVANASATGIQVGAGAELRMLGSGFRGFGTCIYVPSGSTNAIVNSSGSLIDNAVNYEILIQEPTTTGLWQGNSDYLKVSIPINCPFYIFGKDQTIVTVQKSGGDFTSVAAAVNAITNATSDNRYIIQVGAGTYTEPEIVMKRYVSIHGAGRATVIQADSNNHHVIRGANSSELFSFIVTGAGTGYAGIYMETDDGTSTSALMCRDILFNANYLNVWTYGNVGQANVIIFNARYGGTSSFTYGFRATNNNNTMPSKITLLATTSQGFTSPLPIDLCYASGTNCAITLNSFNCINKDAIEAGTTAFRVDNGAHIHLVGVNIEGFDTGILSANSGTGPNVVVVGTSIIDCNTDVNIANPNTIGSIDISATRTKIFKDPNAPISMFIVDPEATGVAFNGPFYYASGTYADITDISSLIIETPVLGVMTGGALSVSSGLILNIGAGTGYNENTSDILKYQIWTSGTVTLPANSTVYVYITGVGVPAISAGYPDTENNIVLGQVSTNATDIIYIQKTPLSARHWSNDAADMFRNALGPLFASGCSVAENGTRQLTVTQGTYYYSANQFTPSGASPATFNIYYRSATAGIFSTIAAQTVVPNTSYDNGTGTLAPLTASYYTKHLLCILGGPSEVYALIYGQAEYSTQGAAEAAGLPLLPSFITSAFVTVASVIVQEGTANIISFLDERPRVGFVSSSVTGTITVHGDLLGLSANDHPQYLLVDGGAPGMTGDLNMNNNNITNVALFNGFNVSAHASRHAFNGADPLPAGQSSDIQSLSDSTNFAGTSNTLIPRADHVHAHGNRGGGSLHATATTTSAGFISASDQLKLNGIQAGATNTTASTQTPLNLFVGTPSPGTSAEVSRFDHIHSINTAAPAFTLQTGTSNTEGTSAALARSDHSHAISSAAPVQQVPDQSNAIGNSTSFARADHIHNIPSGVPVSLDANSTSSKGAASTFAISNHSHAIASGIPTQQSIALALGAGTSANFARADHIHTFATDVPVSISSTNLEGSSTSFSRADHVHAHGIQGGGSLHATATTASAGFISSADQLKLNNTTAATSSPLDVGLTTIGTSLQYARADHIHAHGNQAGGSLHAVASTTSAGFISSSDQLKLNNITAATTSPLNLGVTSIGTSPQYALADHVHAHGTQAGGNLHPDVVSGGLSGFMNGTDKARLDTMTASTLSPLDVGTTAIGTSAQYARSDHVHAHGNQLGGTLHSTATTTSAGFISSSDQLKLNNITAATTSPLNLGATSIGTSPQYALADHVHAHGNQIGGTLHSTATTTTAGFISSSDQLKLNNITAATTAALDLGVSAVGSSLQYARQDHVHAHGNQLGGSLHSTATTTTAGFISSSDQLKLNNITAATTAALDLGVSAVGTSLQYARQDHVHAHGNQAGGSLHSTATTTTAGFISSTDQLKLNNIPAGSTTQIQFNSGGTLSADPNLTWNSSTLTIATTTASTSTTSGALVVSGGLGVATDSYFGGDFLVTGNTYPRGTIFQQYTVTSVTTAGNVTHTAASIVGGILLRNCNGSARTDVTPTAAQLVALVPHAVVGTGIWSSIRNVSTTNIAVTLTAGAGVTLNNTITVAQNTSQQFIYLITNVGTPAITVYTVG
jgi:hypothetical protein